jgi:hypothetical protein
MTSSINLWEESPLRALNHTELYQLCLQARIRAHPATPREYMMAYLTGDADPPEDFPGNHPIDNWRSGIIGFLNDHWATLEPQIKCPAKMMRHPTQPNPQPCYGCLDAQVIACVVQNAKVLHLIELHKPNKR